MLSVVERLRRVGKLCFHVLRNIAFYQAGWRSGKPVHTECRDQFWVTANGSFLDIAVLEWCKLFGDKKGNHYWEKVVIDKEKFRKGLLLKLAINQDDFDKYIEEMRAYRDKFIAHLDDERRMQIPRLKIARKSAGYLWCYLRLHEEKNSCFEKAPKSAAEEYKKFRHMGKRVYSENV